MACTLGVVDGGRLFSRVGSSYPRKQAAGSTAHRADRRYKRGIVCADRIGGQYNEFAYTVIIQGQRSCGSRCMMQLYFDALQVVRASRRRTSLELMVMT